MRLEELTTLLEGKTLGLDYITCPHCGYVDMDTCDYPTDLTEDPQTGECVECGKEFELSMHVVYHCDKAEESDEHTST